MVHKVRPGSISIKLGSWEGKKNRVGNLKGSDIYIYIFSFFSKYSFSSTKKIGKFVGK
jgi:hypothetical protein